MGDVALRQESLHSGSLPDESVRSYAAKFCRVALPEIYVDMQLERRTLFELLRPQPIQTVLYPGSSFHIIPSFYFPYVVYVDPGEHARRFFENIDQVLTIIKNNKRYKRSSYIRYITQDIREQLPLNGLDFDLLIALYVGNAARSCKRYLKMHGLFLTNNHH